MAFGCESTIAKGLSETASLSPRGKDSTCGNTRGILLLLERESKGTIFDDIYELDRVLVIYSEMNCYDLCLNLFDADHLKPVVHLI